MPDRSPRRLALRLALYVLLVGLRELLAQAAADPSSWVGRRVITKFGAVLQVDGKPVDDEELGKNQARGRNHRVSRLYQVKRASGPWVWIEAEESGARGWIQPEFLVPFEEAVGYITGLIREVPTDASRYIWRGNVWMAREEYDIAIGDYGEAIRLDPGEALGFNNRGLAWVAKREFDKALADYNEAIRLDPEWVSPYIHRGDVRARRKEFDRALVDLGEAIRLDPADPDARLGRAEIFSFQKEYDKAIADYAEAIRLDPSDASAFSGRGQARRGMKEYEKALADFAESARLDPDGWGPYEKILVRLTTSRPEVIDDARAAIAAYAWRGNRPIYAAILGHIGARRVGRADESKAFLDEADRKAEKSIWPYPVVRFFRSEIDARALLALATDVDKETEIRCYLGFHHLLDGRVDEAREEFRWVRDHGSATYMQYLLAVAELDRPATTP